VHLNRLSRRALTLGIAALPVAIAATTRTLAATDAAKSVAGASDGLSHSAASILQQVDFDATPPRVYEALTTAKQFEAITRLSDAATLLDAVNAKPTSISNETGGAFTLFGGYIVGRNLQMLQGQRLVQAWHAGSWNAWEFSIVDIALTQAAGKTRLILSHRGFPSDAGASLAKGWHTHYWEPLAKFLAQG
jgi:activator of HSP90 ATPase